MQPIPKYDPTDEQSALQRVTVAIAKSAPGTFLFKNVASHIDPTLIRLTNGHVQLGNGPRVNLTTRGRKSGEERTVTLVYFTLGDDVVLIASSFGRPAHPAWYLNLKADPKAELGWRGGGGEFIAREAEGDERDKLFDLANQLYSGYSKYQAGTDRKIPVVVLSPV